MSNLYRLTPTWLRQLSQLSRSQVIGNLYSKTFSAKTAQRNHVRGRVNPSMSFSMTYSTKSVGPASEPEEVGLGLDVNLINHLERTSLVDFGNQEALVRLEEAIRFADTLFEVDTSGVEPLTSVLENESLYLREDEVDATRRKDILMNASVTEEDYFVSPPGNIPLEPQSSTGGAGERK